MKKLTLTTLTLILSVAAFAQIPYFSGTVGERKLYGYTSLKFRPGLNAMETYSTLQYGVGEHFAAGMDLYTGTDAAYWGAVVRYGYKFSQWFGAGAQFTPSFDLNDSFRYSYSTASLYLNGAITRDGRLFWIYNTFCGLNRGEVADTFTNYEYLGYSIPFASGHSITPLVGAIHSWKFDSPVDLAFGFWYTIKTWSFYLWTNDILKRNPRIVFGVEFVL